MIRYAFTYLQQHTTLSTAEWVLLGELALLGFAVAILLVSLRFLWQALRSVLHSIAALTSCAIAIATLFFLVVRLVRFLG